MRLLGRPLRDIRFWKSWARVRWPALAFLAFLVVLALWIRSGDTGRGENFEAALASALAKRNLELAPGEKVLAIDEHRSFFAAESFVFLAHRPEENDDLYYAELRRRGEGRWLYLERLVNLTRTSSAEESKLVGLGSSIAFGVRVAEGFSGIHLIDFRGEPAALTRDWPWRARLQNWISNRQQNGRGQGVHRVRLLLERPSPVLELSIQDETLQVQLERETLLGHRHEDGFRFAASEHVRAEEESKALPGTITWLVDTVRALDFVGPEPIEWLEHRVFGIKDWAERSYYALLPTKDRGETARELVGRSSQKAEGKGSERRIDGWPPKAPKPLMSPAIAGEGQWVAVDDEAFVRRQPGAPPAFYQSFLRTDPERKFTRVFYTAWDARQIQLHMMPGTLEPESATGETGRGMVPRDPEVLSRLVGAFNGGFQALHGEFGMMADGRVYLPPKPWAATVALYRDGRVALGSWLGAPEGVKAYDVNWALAQIPKGMVSYRQNLTSVVEDGKFNPWERWWWGAAPVHAEEQTYIDRSGLCMNERGNFFYLWGRSLGAEALGRAMLAAGCVRGLHLDMNIKHTGFEFYHIRPNDRPLPALGRRLKDDEFEGAVPGAAQFVVRAKKAVSSMQPMRFPRYIARDPRDFFYLLLKPILPGAPLPALAGDAAKESHFHSSDQARSHWPPPLSVAFVGQAPKAGSFVLRIDPAQVWPQNLIEDEEEGALGGEAEAILCFPGESAEASRTKANALALFAERREVGWHLAIGKPPANARVLLWGEAPGTAGGGRRALGIDREGRLTYIEGQAQDPHRIDERIRQADLPQVLLLQGGQEVLVRRSGSQTWTTIAGEVSTEGCRAAPTFSLLGGRRAEILFPDNPPRPYSVWARLQDTRVRYVRKGPPRFTRVKAPPPP